MHNLIAVQLETCHANADGTAWYAYFTRALPKGPLPKGLGALVEATAKADGAPLGLEFDAPPEEVPSALSEHAGIRRYWVASAA